MSEDRHHRRRTINVTIHRTSCRRRRRRRTVLCLQKFARRCSPAIPPSSTYDDSNDPPDFLLASVYQTPKDESDRDWGTSFRRPRRTTAAVDGTQSVPDRRGGGAPRRQRADARRRSHLARARQYRLASMARRGLLMAATTTTTQDDGRTNEGRRSTCLLRLRGRFPIGTPPSIGARSPGGAARAASGECDLRVFPPGVSMLLLGHRRCRGGRWTRPIV